MPTTTQPAPAAPRPASRTEPVRDERKAAPYDMAPSYLGRQALLRAQAADKKR